MYIWLAAIVFIICLEKYELRDSCTDWRLRIHRGIEESGEALDLGLFVRNFAASVSTAMKPYSNLQLQLEGIAEQHNLFKASDGETNKTIQNLLREPEVQNIIKDCKKFHNKNKCNKHDLYRSADGTCNNLKHPLWGSGDYTMERVLPPAYDGVNGFRKSVTGEDLPMFRSVSLKLKNTTNPSNLVSAFFAFYGQSIVHDITLIPGVGSNINCCANNQTNPSICIAIHNKPNDFFYGHYNYTCYPILRTTPYPTCEFNQRIQANKVTSFLDLSIIYGSSKKIGKAVRGDLGTLKTQSSSKGRILPKTDIKDALFCPNNGTKYCFLSGDERVNQHVQLMSLHTMYVRLHNKVHDILHRVNPHWNGEKLYLESRRLVSALQQHMVYKEYLPLLVGSQNMKKYKLSVNSNKGSYYDDQLSPNMLLEFNTASFRLHSMVPKETSKYHRDITFDISYSFLCPLHSGQLNSYIGGSCEIPSEKNDHFMKDSVQGYLYRPPRATYGDDLASINIARGRDHGLPIYIDMIKKCTDGKTTIKTFSDLKSFMTEENVDLLKSTYKNVRDIDLWVGVILEKEIKDAVTGPTAACVSSIQFQRMKYGDSFFFTHTNGRYPFTKEQLQTIRKYSLSRFLCDTLGDPQVRKYPLKLPSETNRLIRCDFHSSMDLSAWKEKK